MKTIFTFVLVALLLVAGPAENAERLDWITTDGLTFVDSSGRRVILRGFVTVTHNQAGEDKVTYSLEDYQRMRDLGANVQSIRLFAGLTYKDPAYLEQVDRMVSLAKQVGMYTTMKMTMYDIGAFKRRGWKIFWRGRRNYQENVLEAWSRIWRKYKDDSAVVGYDLLNEPKRSDIGDSEDDFMRNYLVDFYRQAINKLREIDDKHPAFIQPALVEFVSRSGEVKYSRFDHSIGKPKIAYAPHFYVSLTQYSTEKYPTVMDRYLSEARRLNAPLFIGEYGLPWSSENDGNKSMEAAYQQTEKKVSRLFDQYGVSATRPWFTNDRAAVGPSGRLNWALIKGKQGLDGPMRAFIIDVFDRPYPQRLAGTLSAFEFDFTAKVFRLNYSPVPEQGTTEIYIPARRHFNQGFTVRIGPNLTLKSDPQQSRGLKILNNPKGVDSGRFAWDSDSQILSIREWSKGPEIQLVVEP